MDDKAGSDCLKSYVAKIAMYAIKPHKSLRRLETAKQLAKIISEMSF